MTMLVRTLRGVAITWTCAAFLAACSSAPPSDVVGLTAADTQGSARHTSAHAGKGQGFEAPAASASQARRPAENVFQAADAQAETSNYRLGPRDQVDIQVYNVAELSRSFEITGDGTIDYPLLGTVPAAGKTSKELQAELETRLGRDYLQNPRVSVYVKSYNSQMFTVDGDVGKPGLFALRGRNSLLQALAMAGGITETADDDVAVFRTVDGKRHYGTFNVADIRAGTAKDPEIKRGDMIVVGKSAIKSTLSEVKNVMPLLGLFTFL